MPGFTQRDRQTRLQYAVANYMICRDFSLKSYKTVRLIFFQWRKILRAKKAK